MSTQYQPSPIDKSAAFKQVKVTLLPDQRMSNQDAAKYLGISISTLNKMRRRREGPDFTAVRGKIFYYKKDLDEFLYYSWYSILNPSHLGQHKRHYYFCQKQQEALSADNEDYADLPF